MPLVVGTNSYVTVSEASTYFTDRLFSDEWDAFVSKEPALISATLVLDSLCDWFGTKTSTTQLLQFPRDVTAAEVPENIKIAQMEIALEAVKQSVISFVESQDRLKTLKADVVTLGFYEKMSTTITIVNSIAKSQLRSYGVCHYGGSISSVPLVR